MGRMKKAIPIRSKTVLLMKGFVGRMRHFPGFSEPRLKIKTNAFPSINIRRDFSRLILTILFEEDVFRE